MFIFKRENITPVIEEARANNCQIILVKDHGLYFMPEKGEVKNDSHVNIAYAEGCNPHTDDWYGNVYTGAGGDDFGEYFDSSHRLFTEFLELTDVHILVEFTPAEISLSLIKKKSS